MLKDELVGTWQLVSLETRRSDGVTTHALGPNARGQFIFDVAGNFSVQLMNPDRTPGSTEGYTAFWGEYEVDENAQKLVLTPQGSLVPSMIGTSTERHVNIGGDGVAVFSPAPQVIDGVETQSFITWRKIS